MEDEGDEIKSKQATERDRTLPIFNQQDKYLPGNSSNMKTYAPAAPYPMARTKSPIWENNIPVIIFHTGRPF